MITVELLGAIDNQQHYSAEDVIKIFQNDRQSLALSSEFVGRPATHIHADHHHVIKIRSELELSTDKAKIWTLNVLATEKKLGVHHPYKTWFILTPNQDSTTLLIGSICPRLQPLHIVLKNKPETEQEKQRYLTLFNHVFKLYLSLAKQQGHKLDEGLSNFAIDDHDALYYLDDEYYFWDNFVALSVMLGVYIRSLTWIDPQFGLSLGKQLVELLNEIFQDSHCQTIIAQQLQAVFMPNEHKQKVLQTLIDTLNNRPTIHLSLSKTSTNSTKTPLFSERYLAIFADIHSNAPALEAVLNFYQQQNITQGIVLGDIVGYGPDPIECIERLKNTDFTLIKGNHDHGVAIHNTERGFSNNAKAVINWTVQQLNAQDKNWLNNLPSIITQEHWMAVHGAPIDPAFFYGYVYIMTAKDNLDYLQKNNIPLCFHGHSHTPGIYSRDKRGIEQHITNQETVALTPYTQALVCPGSVGQPRNKNPDAQCAIYDTKRHEIRFFSVAYQVEPVIQRMQHYNFPSQLWERLPKGL